MIFLPLHPIAHLANHLHVRVQAVLLLHHSQAVPAQAPSLRVLPLSVARRAVRVVSALAALLSLRVLRVLAAHPLRLVQAHPVSLDNGYSISLTILVAGNVSQTVLGMRHSHAGKSLAQA